MRLSEILTLDCIKVPLDATDKQGAIFELVDLLAEKAGVRNPDELKQAVWQREQMRTTGIGCGVAIPHGKSTGCDTLRMAIGKTSTPLEFGAIDGRPVGLIILLASPPDQTGPHIQALAAISRILTDEDFRAALKNATSSEEIQRLIANREAKALAS